MNSPGRLFETAVGADRTPVWLLEWPIERRLRRRVHLAVDTSDSCDGQRPALDSLFRVLALVLSAGDTVSLWLLGRAEKRAEVALLAAGERDRLVQAFGSALDRVRGGTWLADTLAAMVRDRAASTDDPQASFYLIASDGEIFDIDAVAADPAAGFVRLGERECRQMAVVRQRFTEVAASETSLGRFLAAPCPTVQVEPGWRGTRATRFSEDGTLVAGDPFTIQRGDSMVRLAMVGGGRPRPALEYRTPSSSWRNTACECAPLNLANTPHLRRVLLALQGESNPLGAIDWDEARLVDVVAGRSLSCPICGYLVAAPCRSLYCRRCGAFALSNRGPSRRETLDLVGSSVFLRVPLAGGSPAGDAEVCEWDPNDDAWTIVERDGRSWLVLNVAK